MAINKRRHANAIPIASFATWMVIGLFACVAGLGYVYCKNQLHTTGAQIKQLEKDLVDLHHRNESTRASIVALSSTRAIQERVESGMIALTPITDDRIVIVTDRPVAREEPELQPASNPVARP